MNVYRNNPVDTNRLRIQNHPKVPAITSSLTRTLVVASFWIIVLFLGIPSWLLTTAIYRAPLPLKEMQSWADGRACKAEFPLLVDVDVPFLTDPEHLLNTAQHALDDANDFSSHHIRLRLIRPDLGHLSLPSERFKNQHNVAATLRLLPGQPGSGHAFKLNNNSRVIDLFYAPSYNPSSSASSMNLSVFISDTLQYIFSEEQQMISHLLSPSTLLPSGQPSPGHWSANSNGSGHIGTSKVNTADITRKMSRIMRYSPTYHITFSLFTASASPSTWDIVDALEDYVQPLINSLTTISNFTIDSQIQFYASLSSNIIPTWVEDISHPRNGQWILQQQDLSSFINSAEWPLASITSYPTINFILYIPPIEQSPLAIAQSATNAFLIPQWGGVNIFNVHRNKSPSNIHLNKEDLKPAMDIFAAQLLALLGTPSHPSSLPIRLDSLARQRSAELLTSASSTLGSLYRLTLALPSISIPASVATSVASTIVSLKQACQELKGGRVSGGGGSLYHGRNAAAQAEKAFFEKSMVGQVYFPEEHKVAVYLPLMGPVGVPLLISAFKELLTLAKFINLLH